MVWHLVTGGSQHLIFQVEFVHKAEDSRRKPQQGWIPCEDFQRNGNY
ncbi:hypothetical protein HMPREF1051_2843 [Neisseria sicca VK64]|uniref:Uncharacterized protein n=1 Tax=Neisseria sicca VK64 TaxID=1095748 RepID=I2NWZ4_NEISI|nr:hypothetical protein HMPREF1051_2843 [Neisseria sicca VK64]DAS38607.1 MAG TPA: hypothetical protein [Caudoviricetes sp.]